MAGVDDLDRWLSLLAPMTGASAYPGDRRPILNAQISIDTGQPDRLRLTLDPLAGAALGEIDADRLRALCRVFACRPLTDRVLRLYTLGYALPRSLWLGVVPGRRRIVKAYVSSPEILTREWLPQLTRDAGWLPDRPGPAFTTLYRKLVPYFAVPEGVGIAFTGRRWLGTTYYLRSTVSWEACASTAMAEHLHVGPPERLDRLREACTPMPAAAGWSLACRADGTLVDVKLEMAVRLEPRAIARLADGFGIDGSPVVALAGLIERAGLSHGVPPTPVILSLRFVGTMLSSLVAYFALGPA